jgi:NHL repeat
LLPYLYLQPMEIMRNFYLVLLVIMPSLFFSCHKDSNKVAPVLATTPASNITTSTAASGGSFTIDGTLTIISRGIEFDTSSSFQNHWTVTAGSGIGIFSADMSGLMSNTAYYIRAFAIADTSTYYGNILQFTTTYVPSKYKVITVAGTGAPGFTNGDTSSAAFNQPDGVAVDAAGNMYVADSKNNAIRKITPGGTVTTFATTDAPPLDLVLDHSGNVYVTEAIFKILKITPGGQVSTFAGSGARGHADGTGTSAAFYGPITIDIDPAGNLYVADLTSVRKISPGGIVSTLPSFPAIDTCYAVAVDKNFNLYESSSYAVIKVDSSGTESVLAGSGQTGYADGIGTAASFGSIDEIRVDAAGNLYAADFINNKVRLISPAGVVSTFAGTGAAGSMDGNAAIATFYAPGGLAADNDGNIFVADQKNNKIRKILPL